MHLLLGRNPGLLETTIELKDIDSIQRIPEGIPSTILQRRPDILQVEQSAIAANANVGVAEALRYPTFNLTAFLGIASSELSSAANGGNMLWSAGGSVLGPIFYFGQNKRRVEIEEAKARQAMLEYEFALINSFREVEDALIAIQTLKEELLAREDHVRAAISARELSKERYDQGVTTYLEVLETERQAFNAELFYAEVKQQLFNAHVDLYRALGGGWITPEEEQAAQGN
jgi:multidrug efflux system outer membrane protein